MKKVSIVVPIYNSELYLKECVDSLLNQTYKNIEIILVDDGSKDNSVNICKQYIKDSRVKFIKKENGGVSSARNTAIKESTGDYIMFVDSDDFIDSNMIEKYIEGLKKAHFVIGGFKEVYAKQIFLHNPINRVISNKIEIINTLFANNDIGGFLFNKIYDAKIIKKNKLHLDENIHYCEDLLFNINYLLNIKNICIISDSLYNYRMRKSSATWSADITKVNNLKQCFQEIEKLLNIDNLLSEQYLYYKLNLLYKFSSKKIKSETRKEYKMIMNSKSISFKKKIKLFITKNMNFIYTTYMKNKVKKNILFD